MMDQILNTPPSLCPCVAGLFSKTEKTEKSYLTNLLYKTSGFLMYSGGIETKCCLEMG